MSKYKIILFDLDGTLSDPKIGITKSVQYGLSKMGIIEENVDDLEHFIGPPLEASFMEGYQMTQTEARQTIAFYRERFTEKGMFENELYDGIIPLLESLKVQQLTLVIATSKPTVFAEEIAAHFGIASYFDHIIGSNLDGTRIEKGDIIQHIVDLYKDNPLEDFIMIGDRKYDIIGANKVGIDSIGVTYGYGSEMELQEENPSTTKHSVSELVAFFYP